LIDVGFGLYMGGTAIPAASYGQGEREKKNTDRCNTDRSLYNKKA
jgi:hypothetical protein